MTPMDREQARALTERYLREATSARRDGLEVDCCAALSNALESEQHAESPSLVARVSWRLSKAHFDFGNAIAMMDAIVPLLDDDPFKWYERGLQAVEPMARRYWDEVGYDTDAVLRLWRAWSQHHRKQGDRFQEASGQVQQGWHQACSGDLNGLRATFQKLLRLTPRDLATSPYRHSDALEDGTSVFHLQMDIARFVLRAATWAEDERLAWDAYDQYEDAIENAGIKRKSDFWFLESSVRAGWHFSWKETEQYTEAYHRSLLSTHHDRQDLHMKLGKGWQARANKDHKSALAYFTNAAHVAERQRCGFEWIIDAHLERTRSALATGQPEQARKALEKADIWMDRAAVGVFLPAVKRLRKRL